MVEYSKAVQYNAETTAKQFKMPDDEQFEYEHDGQTYDDGTSVRQCCYVDSKTKTRCRSVAVYGTPYCDKHAGVPKINHKGMKLETLLSCNACRKYKTCPYVGVYTDIYGDKRCVIEKTLMEKVIVDFVYDFNLDFSRIENKIMLDRLAYNYVALQRAQDMLSVTGEIVNRQHTNLDGSIEEWVELHPIVAYVDKLDAKVALWIKMLQDKKDKEDKLRATQRVYYSEDERIMDILAEESKR